MISYLDYRIPSQSECNVAWDILATYHANIIIIPDITQVDNIDINENFIPIWPVL